MADKYMEQALPMFPRRRDPLHDLDNAILDPENVPELIGPGISFLQRIGDFTAAEKNFLFADKCVPLEAAGHPYFVFQFQISTPGR
jgi:hypothetical protein